MNKKFFILLLMPALLLLSACNQEDDTEPKVPPTSMTITVEGDIDLSKPQIAGTSIQLVPQFTPTNTTETRIAWGSSNPSVATIADNGLLVLLNNGTAIITAVSMGNPTLIWSVSINVTGGTLPLRPEEGPEQNEAE